MTIGQSIAACNFEKVLAFIVCDMQQTVCERPICGRSICSSDHPPPITKKTRTKCWTNQCMMAQRPHVNRSLISIEWSLWSLSSFLLLQLKDNDRWCCAAVSVFCSKWMVYNYKVEGLPLFTGQLSTLTNYWWSCHEESCPPLIRRL